MVRTKKWDRLLRWARAAAAWRAGWRLAFCLLLVLGFEGIAVAAKQDKQDDGAPQAERPNILWITCEDIGPHLGCYGDAYAVTPNLDRLAARGMRYRRAWSNAPVCAPARTTIITGVYATSLGGQHMRSLVRMPPGMQMYPQLLRQLGYYCTNNRKEDYNLVKPGRVWDDSSGRAHWKNRPAGQPFFAVFNLTVSHESQLRKRPHTLKHDPAKVRLPAYHPDTPEVRHDWAQYYDKITEMDAQAGRRLAELQAAGLMDETIIFFYGDHGSGMPRNKRWPYDSGLRVPLIVYVPEKYRHLAPDDYVAGGQSERLVSFVDLAPTLLSLAGAKRPEWMQGRAFMGPHAEAPRTHLFGFRGRMDERLDMVRSVCDGRYVYVRNYMPHLIYGQYLQYMFQTPTTRVWRRLYDEGKLRPPQTYFWEPKPAEELYDLENDRDEVRNLVGSPEAQPVLERLRAAHRQHVLDVRDTGFLSEAEMHRRAGERTIYEMAHDRNGYPLERIFETAQVAASRDASQTNLLKERLSDADSGVRYWAAMGLLIRGPAAVGAGREALHRALADPSPSVRAIAAWALGEHGNQDDLAAALETLGQLVSPAEQGPYMAVLAVNVVELLGPKGKPLYGRLATMPTKAPNAPPRVNGYVDRLLAYLLNR